MWHYRHNENFDSHMHLFTNKVITNISKRWQPVLKLKLQTVGADY